MFTMFLFKKITHLFDGPFGARKAIRSHLGSTLNIGKILPKFRHDLANLFTASFSTKTGQQSREEHNIEEIAL